MMKRPILCLALFGLLMVLAAPASSQHQNDRTLLAPTYPLETLGDLIAPPGQWKPFPSVADPAGFDRIPAHVRRAYIEQGETYVGEAWKPLPATVFLEYVRNGNRSNYQDLSFGRRARLSHLVLAEAFEREGRFLDEIVDGIWAISEESFWGVPAHLGSQEAGHGLPDVNEPVVDLFAAETGVLLAWTHYLLAPALDEVNPLVADRIASEVDRRIFTPYLERDDWGWMGYQWRQNKDEVRPVNNWNPWINSNVIAMALLLEQDPQRRLQLVHKAMDSMDNFIEPYPADGGCDEGPSYWGRAGASLFDALEWLHMASDGRIDIFETPLIRKMGQYIYRTYISDPYFVNFADASARMRPNASLVYRYGRAIGDETMMGFGAFISELEDYGSGVLPGSSSLSRTLPALFALDALLDYPAREPLVSEAYFPDLQVMTARSRPGSREGFFMAAKGGHNAESHNHNDIGNFIVYHDGRPVLIDAGAQTYTAQTFSSRRYELWNNQSAYHNVPTINGAMQPPGRQYAARAVDFSADEARVVFRADLAGAYPEEADVERWERTITLDRVDDVVEISEDYRLGSVTEPPALHFLTPLEAVESGTGQVALTDAETGTVYTLRYDTERFSPSFEEIEIEDDRMLGSWGSLLRRVTLTSRTDRPSDRFTIRVEAAPSR